VKVVRYQWQPTSAEIARAAGVAVDEVIRFDQNTSPFGTEWARQVVASGAASLNDYPAADYRTLREAAAAAWGLQPQQVVPGAGVDELVILCARAFLTARDRAIAPGPTYSLYQIATVQIGAGYEEIPAAAPDFALPLDEVVGAARDAALVWLCAPNNPTGQPISADAVAAVVAACDGLVVIDAAYAEFSGDDWAPWIDRHDNVIVLRTLSKAYGLAAARVGLAMAHPAIIDAIDAIRPPGSVTRLSTDLAIDALRSQDRMRHTVDAIVTERAALAERLAGLGLRVLPSSTNFLLCEVGPEAHQVADSLMRRALVVRTFAAGGPLGDYLRFTVRTAPEHDRLVDTLEQILP
jgi:histidinol-phosphate aminotransferase